MRTLNLAFFRRWGSLLACGVAAILVGGSYIRHEIKWSETVAKYEQDAIRINPNGVWAVAVVLQNRPNADYNLAMQKASVLRFELETREKLQGKVRSSMSWQKTFEDSSFWSFGPPRNIAVVQVSGEAPPFIRSEILDRMINFSSVINRSSLKETAQIRFFYDGNAASQAEIESASRDYRRFAQK